MRLLTIIYVCGLGVGADVAIANEFKTSVYGYVNAYIEKVNDTPTRESGTGNTTSENNPHEFDTPNINMMVSSTYGANYKMFLNLSGGGGSMEVANAWVEGAIAGDLLKARFGKIYRRFGLYNEILDAVPTYIGIEPPELFDGDHLMLTRTTNAMLHGNVTLGDNVLKYAVMTGNDEKESDQFPLGLDFRISLLNGQLLLGTSYYTTNGNAVPDRGVGEGSPGGGILPWMAQDRYSVVGGFAHYETDQFIIQVASFQAKHEAVRDASGVQTLLSEADLNTRQQTRLQGASEVDYDVSTSYVRAAYILDVSDMEVTPYIQHDIYENEETISQKTYGGDNEAGFSDDGKFTKSTVGVVIRPVSMVAIKLDASQHNQKFNAKDEPYAEVRASFSLFWRL